MWVALALLASAPTSCPVTAPFPSGIGVVRVVHVVTGTDGESHFAPDTLVAEQHDYFTNGKMFARIDLAATAKVRLVSGPADVTLPTRPAFGHEMFLTIKGSSFLTLPNGAEEAITPGTLVVFDDMTSKIGHGGRTGPCGYVALQIIPDTPIR